MGKVYDDWARLVEAVLRREKDRQLCLQNSFSTCTSSNCSPYHQLDEHQLHQTKVYLSRLVEELISSLNHNNPCFEPILTGSLGAGEWRGRDCFRIRDEPKEYALDLGDQDPIVASLMSLDFLYPQLIPQIKSIANTMFASNQIQDFCLAFIRFARDAFTIYLRIFEVEESCIDNVRIMEYAAWRSSVRRWNCAMKTFVGYYLNNGKAAFDQILGDHGDISLDSFIESSKASVMALFNFGRAMVIRSPQEPERILVFLDMYEVLAKIIPSVNALFPKETGSFIRVKFYNLLLMLRDSIKLTLKELENQLVSYHGGAKPFADRGASASASAIAHLTKDIMNLLLCLGQYNDTLNSLLERKYTENLDIESNISIIQNPNFGPLAAFLQNLTSALVSKLDQVSEAYEPKSLKHVFMMNNINYIIQKVTMSDKLSPHFSDEWIRNHVDKLKQHTMGYEKFTQNSAISSIRQTGASKGTPQSKLSGFGSCSCF